MALPSWRAPIASPRATGSKLRHAFTNESPACSLSITSHRLRHCVCACGGGSGASIRRRCAIVATLAHLRLIDAPDPPPQAHTQCLSLCEVIDKLHAGDSFVKAWRSFDPVARGEAIGARHDGSAIVAPFDGFVVFPNPRAEPGHEWFYLARPSPRLA